jgi:hypothetical protein
MIFIVLYLLFYLLFYSYYDLLKIYLYMGDKIFIDSFLIYLKFKKLLFYLMFFL